MAYFILKNRGPKDLFVHYNGDYHSKNRGGTYWYLKRYDLGITVLTISSVSRTRRGLTMHAKIWLTSFLSCLQSRRKGLRRHDRQSGALSGGRSLLLALLPPVLRTP